MGRPRKDGTPAAPPRKKEPTGPLDLRKRIAQVNRREAENARREAASVRVDFTLPLIFKERLLDLAERHDEPLTVVMRACLEYGYRYYNAFAQVDGESPFSCGVMGFNGERYGQPRPGRSDPAGTRFPPAAVPRTFAPPGPDARFFPQFAPAGRETVYQETDDDFSPPPNRVVVNGKTVPLSGILPSSGGEPEPLPTNAPHDLPAPASADEPPPPVEETGVFAFGASEETVPLGTG